MQDELTLQKYQVMPTMYKALDSVLSTETNEQTNKQTKTSGNQQ
jgi:hypothetical protein